MEHWLNTLIGRLAFAAILTSPMISRAQFEDVSAFDPVSKSVAQIELPISGTGLGKCSGAFIRWDAVITETHCVINEDITHRVLVGTGPNYDKRVIFLTRRIVLPKRFQKPDVAILFLRAKSAETLAERQQLVEPLPIATTPEYAWRVDRPMSVIAFGHRDGDTRLRKHNRIGTVFPWLAMKKVVSPRTQGAYIVPGDSGGAALISTPTGWKLWALVWAIDLDRDLFLHVHAFQEWIQKTLANEPMDLKQR